MPNLRDIKKRIASVKKTQQITRAMKMVSAAKLRKFQGQVLASRPYSKTITEIVRQLTLRVDTMVNPLLQEKPGSKELYILITSDRGLCGSFNTNIIRYLMNHLKDKNPDEFGLLLAGRKARDFFKRREYTVEETVINFFNNLDYSHSIKIGDLAIDYFLNKGYSKVFLVYNEFKSVMTQNKVMYKLLPVKFDSVKAVAEPDSEAPAESKPEKILITDYIYEPSAGSAVQRLLTRYIHQVIYHALRESMISEHASRMTAMDSATENAYEMIDKLTLIYNRVRQASITKEIVEISTGAEALK